ncbi:MAG: hypothetical protein R3Y60_03060 [bacterium]
MFHVDKIMKFLDENIVEEDRKLYTKLSIHIKKSNTRSLNLLASKYNIDKKKYIFPPNARIDNNYLHRLEELILTCRWIISEKIDISTFNVERFHEKKQLDLSNLNKIIELLRHLKTFNMRHNAISVSKEVLESPLLILTITTKKKFDVQVLEKHAFDYFSNHALVEDKSRHFGPEESILSVSKKNYILDKNANLDVKPEIVKEAILDYFKTSGEFYYISAEAEAKVSKDVHAMIEKKNTSVAKKSSATFFTIEFIGPIIALLLSAVSLIISLTTNSSSMIATYILFFYTIFNVVLYLYRHGLVKEDKHSFSAKYYKQKPKQFLYFGLIVGLTLILQVVNLYRYSDTVSDGIISIGAFLSSLYYKDTSMFIVTIIIAVALIAIIICAIKFSRYHIPEIFTAISALLLFILISIRMHFWEFASFRNYSIVFSMVGVSILLYLLINSKRGKIKNLVLFSFFMLDFLLLILLNNQFYLRTIFFELFG